jgi:hypothetical protein
MAIGVFDQEVLAVRGGLTAGRAVRPEGSQVVACERCGCRLTTDAGTGSWVHFSGIPGSDARGCRVECVELAHELVSFAA